MRAGLLILLFYLLIGFDLWVDEQLLAIRYLHFAWLAFAFTACALMLYLILFHFAKALWFVPAWLFIVLSWWLPFVPVYDWQKNSSATDTAPTTTVLSFSLNASNRSFEQIAGVLKQHPADVVCLQEVTEQNLQPLLQALNHHSPYPYYNFSLRSALLLLSRTPLIPVKTMPYQKSITRLDGRMLTLWNIHSPKSLKQEPHQDRFLKHLGEDLQSDQNTYKIACGDFNSTPQNTAMQNLLAMMKPAFRSSQRKNFFSYPTPKSGFSSPYPFIKIDYLLFSPAFDIHSYERLDAFADSDHYPIKASVSFKD